MSRVEKKHITLSIPVSADEKLEEIATKHNLTKSGLVNFWINQTMANDGNIFR